jgi:type IV pilus assembly protein PilE
MKLAARKIYHCISHTKNGFTLVELLIVMAILAILAAMAMPSYQTITRNIQRTEAQALLLEIQTHLERYYFVNQHYPKGLSALSAYADDQLSSDNAYYEIRLAVPGSDCPVVSCYRLIAEHASGQASETLVLHSNGQREGYW